MALTRPKIAQIYTNVTALNDAITVLNAGASQANVDVGLLINRAHGLLPNAAFYYSETLDTFVTAFTNNSGGTDSNIVVTDYADITSGNVYTTGLYWTGNGQPITLSGGTGSYGDTNVAAYLAGNITVGNVSATGYYWANGTPFVSSSYGNTDVAAYLLVDSTITGLQANAAFQANLIDVLTGNAATQGSLLDVLVANAAVQSANLASLLSNAGVQADSISSLLSNASAQESSLTSLLANAATQSTYIDSINANVAAANAAIITANTAMKSYVDAQDAAITNAWTANAGAQADAIAGANAAIITANSAVVSYVDTLNAVMASNVDGANAAIVTANTAMKGYVDDQIVSAGGYGNTQVAAYLPTHTGNITANNITTTGNIVGGGVRNTAGTTAPANPSVGDTWYDTDSDTLLRYIDDGDSYQWVDISGIMVGEVPSAYGNAQVATYLANTVTVGAMTVTGNITGNLLPSANVTYNLGSDNQRWKDLYLSGSTIYLGSSIFTQSNGSMVIIPPPTVEFPNPTGLVISPYGTISTVTTSNGNVTSTVVTSNTNSFSNITVTADANIGNVVASTYYFSNGSPLTTSFGLAGTSGTGSITSGGTMTFAGTYGVTAAVGSGTVTIATPQDLRSTAIPTFAGATVNGNVSITGKLTVDRLESVTAMQITVQDPLLYLNANVLYPWTYDTGIYSQAIGGPANVYAHHGMVRSSASGQWGFFSNVQSEPGLTINWSDTGLIWDAVKAGELVVANSTAATSTTTGALQVAGGIGVQGNAVVNAIYTDNYKFANGAAFSSGSTYGNTQVAAYLPTHSANVGATNLVPTGNIVQNGWTTYATASKLTIYYNNSPLFSVYTNGNIVAAGDVTAYGSA